MTKEVGWSPVLIEKGFVLMLCLVSCAGGGSIILKGVRMWNQESRRNAAIRDHPREPWLWEPDWPAREIRHGQRSELYKLLVALGGLLSGILVLICVSATGRSGLWPLWIVAAGCVAMLIAGLVLWRRQTKFRQVILHLDTVPVFLGSRFSSQLCLPTRFQLAHPPRVGLECVHAWLTGSGRNAVRSEKILWQESLTVPIERISQDVTHRIIVPIEMNLPEGLPPTDDTDPRNSVCWRLHFQAELPGFNANEIFRVPIYDRSGLQRTPAPPRKTG
ncbi:MAG: hypothetical protein PHQ04_05290 [Opitutaceae bacterium]|nr:hypothetical protein [Opitutaceae bacterium]